MLSTIVTWRGSQPYEKGGPAVPEYLRLDVGGLASDSGEHLRWVDRKLKRGDVISIRVVEAASADKPRERKRPDPAADLRAKKRYVRKMAKELGWRIVT